MMLVALTMAAAVAGATPAPAATGAPGASAAGGAAAEDPNKVICRADAVTGSRFIRKVCMKRYEWAEHDRVTERNLQMMQDRQGISKLPPGGLSN